MLIALLAATLLGGSEEPIFDKQTRSAIKQTITDDERKSEVLAALKQIESSRTSATKAAKSPRSQLAGLEADRSAEVNEIEGALDEIVGLRNGIHEDFVDGIFDMRKNMTADEWQAVFGSD